MTTRVSQSTSYVGGLLAVLFVVLMMVAGQAGTAYAADEITVETRTGPHRFTIEWASTSAERERGLMGRESLPVDHGMMFDFGVENPVTFWMKNTPLSLDMIFIGADGVVRRVEHATEPFSLKMIPSGAPVRYVLEVEAGTAKRVGVTAGDRFMVPAHRGQ